MGVRTDGKFSMLGVKPETRAKLAKLAEEDGRHLYEELDVIIDFEIGRRKDPQAVFPGMRKRTDTEEFESWFLRYSLAALSKLGIRMSSSDNPVEVVDRFIEENRAKMKSKQLPGISSDIEVVH